MKLIQFITISLSFISICLASDRPERPVEIIVATYASDTTPEKQDRVFVIGNRVYRSFEEVVKRISGAGGYPTFQTRFIINGSCDAMDPIVTSEEIETLTKASDDAGVLFTYNPAG